MNTDTQIDIPATTVALRPVVRRLVLRTAKCTKMDHVRDLQAGFQIDSCSCGKIPRLSEIHSWPAQYQIKCECGNYALGRYWAYSEDDGTKRHVRASLDALHKWNRTKEIENVHDEEAWLASVRRNLANLPVSHAGE